MPRHKRDWPQYNKQLINRGNLNFWFTKKALKFWEAKKEPRAWARGFRMGSPCGIMEKGYALLIFLHTRKKLNFQYPNFYSSNELIEAISTSCPL